MRNLTTIIVSWASVSYLPISYLPITNYNYFSDFSTKARRSIELPYLSQSYLMLLSPIKHFKLFGTRPPAKAHSERCLTSLMKRFAKMVNGFKPFTDFVKHAILDVCQGSEYVSVPLTSYLIKSSTEILGIKSRPNGFWYIWLRSRWDNDVFLWVRNLQVILIKPVGL